MFLPIDRFNDADLSVPSKQWATGSIPALGTIILNLNLSNLAARCRVFGNDRRSSTSRGENVICLLGSNSQKMPGLGKEEPPPGYMDLSCVGQKVVLDGDPLHFYRASATWALAVDRLSPVKKSVPCAKGLLVSLDVLACHRFAASQ